MVLLPGIDPGFLHYQCSVMPLYYKSLFGAANEVRTRDVLLGKQVLYQLSYNRIQYFAIPKEPRPLPLLPPPKNSV